LQLFCHSGIISRQELNGGIHIMSKVCAISWGANVQKVKVVNTNGSTQSLYVCTRCLRSGAVERV